MYFSQKWILFKSPKQTSITVLFSHTIPNENLSNFFYQSRVDRPCVYECVWPCIVKGWCVFSVQVHALWFQNSLWGFGVLILRSHSWTQYRGAVYGGKRAGNRAWRSKAGQRRVEESRTDEKESLSRGGQNGERMNRGKLKRPENNIESSIRNTAEYTLVGHLRGTCKL